MREYSQEKGATKDGEKVVEHGKIIRGETVRHKSIMKLSHVGLIGDVHAEDENLEAVLRFLREAEVQRIFCVGDVVDGRGDGNRCCRLLRDFEVITVRGNHDRWLLQNQMRDLPDAMQMETLHETSRRFLASLPVTQSVETVSGELLLCHGLGANDMQGLAPDDFGYALQCNDELRDLIAQRRYRFVVCGHTHRRMVRHFDHLTVINSGTLYRLHEPCFTLADFKNNSVAFHNVADGTVEDAARTIELSPPTLR